MIRTACNVLTSALLATAAGSASAAIYVKTYDTPVHRAYGYEGVSTRVDVPLCPSGPAMYIAARNVAAAFNRRDGSVGNVLSPSDPTYPPLGTRDVEAVLAHEIGHTLGIGHAESTPMALGGLAPGFGVAPARRGANGVVDALPGADGIFGTEDDWRGDDVNVMVFPLTTPGNTPFEVPVVADRTTMTSDRALRSNPNSWPFVAWAPVAVSLGLPPTSSVMIAAYGVGGVTRRPSAQELTMLKYAESGIDGLAGTTDDYELFLYVVPPATPSHDRPEGCIVISISPDDRFAGALAITFPVGSWSFVEPCFAGTAECIGLTAIRFNPDYNWHFPTTDTSNGEADFRPRPEIDAVVEMEHAAMVVTAGVPQRLTATVRTRSGAPLPTGSRVRITHHNGVLSVLTDGVVDGEMDVGGAIEREIPMRIDGDGVQSGGPILVTLTAPGIGTAVGRTDVTDLSEIAAVSLAPQRIQLPRDLPTAVEAPFEADVNALVRFSASQTPIANAAVRTQACEISTLQGALSRMSTGCETLGVPCPTYTDSNGRALLSGIAFADGAGLTDDPVDAWVTTVVTVEPPRVAVDLDVLIAGGAAPLLEANDAVTFTITATNTSEHALEFSHISSDRTTASACTPTMPVMVEPGAAVVCEAGYTVTADDVALRLPITIDVNGYAWMPLHQVYPAAQVGRPVAGGLPAATLDVLAELTDDAIINGAADADETIAFAITVTNTGGIPLDDVVLGIDGVDPDALICLPALPATLAPGEAAQCASIYTVTAEDAATLSALAPTVAMTAQADGAAFARSAASPEIPLSKRTGELRLSLEATLDDTLIQNGTGDAGERIGFALTATNVGESLLQDVTVDLSHDPALSCLPPLGSTLLPGESMACTGAYYITVAEAGAQLPVIAVATAEATAPAGTVLAEAESRTSTAFSAGHVSLTTTATIVGRPEADPATVKQGETLRLQIEARNTGGRTLTGAHIQGTGLGPECAMGILQRLRPGETMACVQEHTVTATDAAVGSIDHIASVSATPFIPFPPDGEAHCRVTLDIPDALPAEAVIGFEKATGVLSFDRDAIVVSLLDQASLAPQTVTLTAIDQLGEPMDGLELPVECSDAIDNRLRVEADRATIGSDGTAAVALRLADTGTGTLPFAQSVECAVRNNGFEARVRISGATARVFGNGFEGAAPGGG
jgi:hypothetical protein